MYETMHSVGGADHHAAWLLLPGGPRGSVLVPPDTRVAGKIDIQGDPTRLAPFTLHHMRMRAAQSVHDTAAPHVRHLYVR